MGNLVTAAGEDAGENGTNQLLGSAFAEAEAPSEVPSSQRQEERTTATHGGGAMARRGHKTSRQPSPTHVSLGSSASLVPKVARSFHQAAQRGGSARGQGPDLRARRQPPRVAVTAPKHQAWPRQAAAVAARSRRPRASPSSPPYLAPVAENLSPGSPSDEQRMLPRPQLSPPVSAPEIRRPSEQRDDRPPALPVDAIVNSALPPRRLSAFRRLLQFKRALLLSGVTLSLATTILTVLTWKLLNEPLGDDVARNASYLAQMLLLTGGDAVHGSPDNASIVGANESASLSGEAAGISAAPGGDDAAPLF
ncbi:uncharacterized protein LOC125944258 [Dermacentor silvarum]|uniref:uncharacterized protein LOC125944258 n=1 Tax=Dermacentor silvarum TaxID=543639 RepID=UPI002100A509|nr:uncharacterized protein LOC125944258 [Dermacentor silvarum]